MAARGLGEQFCGYTYFTHITSMFDFSVLIIIIIISTTMFMVLSSWQSHCESSPGSFDECRMAPSGRRPKTKPVLTVCKPVKLCRDSAMLSLLVSKGRMLKSEDTAVNVADSELSVQNCLYFVF